MRSVSIVMAYYNNPQMLQMQYQWMRDLPEDLRAQLEYVVVDDGSKQPAVPPDPALGMGFQMYRIGVDIRWNQDAARNIGVEHATKEWVLLTDQDHLVPEQTLRRLMTFHLLDGDNAYRFKRLDYPSFLPYKFHPNSWFMTRDLYQRMGGYDERFAGWYGTDSDFRDRVTEWAEKVIQLEEPLFRMPREVMPDASCPKNFGRKSPMDGAAINRIKADRKAEKDPRPKRLSFPYVRVV